MEPRHSHAHAGAGRTGEGGRLMPRRRTRKEQQAHTRSCLMKSAAKVFARRGLQQASIDEVAEDAGFTKGAFYANFKSKEELFLAMLDERFAGRIEEIDRATGDDSEPEEQARRAGVDFSHYLAADPEWQRLFFEFAAHAARNEDFREELVTRYGALRERIAAVYERRAEELGIEPPVPHRPDRRDDVRDGERDRARAAAGARRGSRRPLRHDADGVLHRAADAGRRGRGRRVAAVAG